MSERTGRIAVNLVEAEVLAAGWLFREQPISDQGIDAHIESVVRVPGKRGDDELGTGRLVALQIKGGPSQFRRPSPNGWWFAFDERKASLWLGHALPVVVVLVDEESREIYWQRVSPSTVVSTGKRFKMEVPRDQTLKTAGPALANLASGLEQLALARYEYSLLGVPPVVRAALRDRPEPERADAALLAMHLSEGRGNPSGTVRSLLSAAPIWLTRNPDWAWRVLGRYSSDHDLLHPAAEAFDLSAVAATEDAARARDLLNVSVLLWQTEPDRAREALREAEAISGADAVLVAIARTVHSRAADDPAPWDLDALLAGHDERVSDSAAAQRLLAVQARRAGDLGSALLHARAAVSRDEHDDELKSLLADLLIASQSRSVGSVADLNEAAQLLRGAIEDRRNWSGPTEHLVSALATAYWLAGDLERLVNLGVPPPLGAAVNPVPEPALRLGAYAAAALGRSAAVKLACDHLGEGPAAHLIRLELTPSEGTQPEELLDATIAAFRWACVGEDVREAARLGVRLAENGVDVRDELSRFVSRNLLPESALPLATALLAAHEDLDSALPSLRDLARSDPVAGEYLVGLLRQADRPRDAAEAAGSLFELTGSDIYLFLRAKCLIAAEAGPEAVAAALRAVGQTAMRPVDRADLLTFLAARSADQRDWTDAERYLTQVLELFEQPDDSAVWRLVVALTNQGRVRRAAHAIARYHPQVRNKSEAELWLRAHGTLRWNRQLAMDAYALAERFADDPQLSTALLGHIVLSTRGTVGEEPDGELADADDTQELHDLNDAELDERRALAQDAVPGELHRRAFELMERIVERHGDETGVRVLKGEDADDVVGQTLDILKEASRAEEAISTVVALARECRVPIGLLAGCLGRGYATLVIQRALGVLVAASANDDEHESESAAAREHFGGDVVVDASTVVSLAGLRHAGELTGRFGSLVTAPAAMFGLHRAAFDVRGLAGSPGSIRWDSIRAELVATELSADEFRRMHRRSELVQQYADRIEVREVAERTVLADLMVSREHSEWIDVLQLAVDREAPLWSDDLALRRLARDLGVVAFGTPAVVDAVRDDELDRADDTSLDQAIDAAFDRILELASDMIVDLPLGDEGLLLLAQADGWRPGAAAAAMSRPAWWAANPHGVAVLERIYESCAGEVPEFLPAWQYAAMLGTARLLEPTAASAVLATLALLGYGESEPTDDVRISGLREARQVASDLGYPDPLSAVAASAMALARTGKCREPERMAERLVRAFEA